jgi:hypothetical protein
MNDSRAPRARFDFSTAELIKLGGLEAWAVSGKPLHWNIDVPGGWVGPHTLDEVGSYVSRYYRDCARAYRSGEKGT